MAHKQTRHSISVSNAVYARLEKYCREHGLSKSSVVETLLGDLPTNQPTDQKSSWDARRPPPPEMQETICTLCDLEYLVIKWNENNGGMGGSYWSLSMRRNGGEITNHEVVSGLALANARDPVAVWLEAIFRCAAGAGVSTRDSAAKLRTLLRG